MMRPGLLIFLTVLLAAPSPLRAQQPTLQPGSIPADELWLKLTSSSGRRKLDLVIAEFDAAGGTADGLGRQTRDIGAVFEADLRFSLYFTFQQPDSGGRFRFATDERKIDLKGWATTGAQVLICGDLALRRSGNQVQLRIYDLEALRLIATKSYPLTSQWRWLAHQMADEVIKLLTGEDGVSRTRIAFSRALDRATKELCVVDYDGENLTQVTGTGGLKLYPDWAPAGTKLTYCSYGTSTLNIYTMDLVARKSTVVSDRSGLNASPAWSPDGKTLLASLSFEGQSEIYTLGPDGRNARRLTHSPGIDISPCWSPTGRQIAFVSDRTGMPQVYVMNADGTDLRRLTYEGSYNTSPAWSPRGDLIAFVQRQPDQSNQVCVTNITGDTYMRLTATRNSEDPCWSPDGLHLAFTSNRTGAWDLYTMDWNGTNLRRITSTNNAYSPAWSPRLRQ